MITKGVNNDRMENKEFLSWPLRKHCIKSLSAFSNDNLMKSIKIFLCLDRNLVLFISILKWKLKSIFQRISRKKGY